MIFALDLLLRLVLSDERENDNAVDHLRAEQVEVNDCDIGSFRWKRIQNYNAQSARTLENLVAETVVHTRSGMNGYELCDHLSEHFFRAIGGYFPNFCSSVGSASEETYSQQAVYASYT